MLSPFALGLLAFVGVGTVIAIAIGLAIYSLAPRTVEGSVQRLEPTSGEPGSPRATSRDASSPGSDAPDTGGSR